MLLTTPNLCRQNHLRQTAARQLKIRWALTFFQQTILPLFFFLRAHLSSLVFADCIRLMYIDHDAEGFDQSNTPSVESKNIFSKLNDICRSENSFLMSSASTYLRKIFTIVLCLMSFLFFANFTSHDFVAVLLFFHRASFFKFSFYLFFLLRWQPSTR